ncbi:hypothetical protein GWI33_022667 [Rhynchophorus ferrugineus]|uniref:Protein sleepless n=1 Tax=Rhynchophorus ferrugineus TaxID=354439 RepID=A0A834IUB8_RHYFE|nr:hypothetical protein GWI33_022667 [Rhynchophorus ferrugineus]
MSTEFLLGVILVCSGSAILSVSANVTRCYHCNSVYCGDPYDVVLATSINCVDVYLNARAYFGKSAPLKKLNDSQVGVDNSKDIETIETNNVDDIIRQRSHAEFFDIQRKIWQFFNKGEIDENTQYACVKANYRGESGDLKTYRGCVPRSTKTITTPCDFVSQKVIGSSGSSVYGCYACNNDLCNSGITFRGSLLVLLAGVALKVVF